MGKLTQWISKKFKKVVPFSRSTRKAKESDNLDPLSLEQEDAEDDDEIPPFASNEDPRYQTPGNNYANRARFDNNTTGHGRQVDSLTKNRGFHNNNQKRPERPLTDEEKRQAYINDLLYGQSSQNQGRRKVAYHPLERTATDDELILAHLRQTYGECSRGEQRMKKDYKTAIVHNHHVALRKLEEEKKDKEDSFIGVSENGEEDGGEQNIISDDAQERQANQAQGVPISSQLDPTSQSINNYLEESEKYLDEEYLAELRFQQFAQGAKEEDKMLNPGDYKSNSKGDSLEGEDFKTVPAKTMEDIASMCPIFLAERNNLDTSSFSYKYATVEKADVSPRQYSPPRSPRSPVNRKSSLRWGTDLLMDDEYSPSFKTTHHNVLLSPKYAPTNPSKQAGNTNPYHSERNKIKMDSFRIHDNFTEMQERTHELKAELSYLQQRKLREERKALKAAGGSDKSNRVLSDKDRKKVFKRIGRF